jgi:hypothetical protein
MMIYLRMFQVLAVLLLATQAQGAALGFRDFRLEGVGIFGAGSSYSGVLSYLPQLTVTPSLALKGNFGISVHRMPDGWNSVLIAGALLGYRVFEPLTFEVGGGAQSWPGADSAPMWNTNLTWGFAQPVFARVTRLVVGYSRVGFAAPFNEVRLGVEWVLGPVPRGNSDGGSIGRGQ